jgi:N-acetylmuramoyl-L-alanine amidase CwlA
MNIIEQFIPTTRKLQRPQLVLIPKRITVHSPGNPGSTAKNEADNVCYNSTRQASFHYVVGEIDIYNVLPPNEIAWHAGDGNGKNKQGKYDPETSPGNCTSIGIEIIETGDRKKVLLNTVSLVQLLMKNYNIPITEIYQHYHWTKKDCPRILRNNAYIKEGLNWDWFIKQLNNSDISDALKIIADKAQLEKVSIDFMITALSPYLYYKELITSLAKAMK